MKKENSISFNTRQECRVCRKGFVLVKFTRHQMSFRNGLAIYGGTSNVETIANTDTSYFCGKCGAVFVSTPFNRLSEDLDSHEKIAMELLENTKPKFLNRSLFFEEIFEKIQKDVEEPIYSQLKEKDDDFFEEGFMVRVPSGGGLSYNVPADYPSFETAREFHPSPFIVCFDEPPYSKLVWWSEKFSKDVLLTKEERSEIRKKMRGRLAELKKEHGEIEAINSKGSTRENIPAILSGEILSIENCLKNLKSKKKTVSIDNEPLPESSTLADFVLAIDHSNNVRSFYIPAYTLE